MASVFYILALVASVNCMADMDDTFDESKHGVKWAKCKAGDKFMEAENLDRDWYNDAMKKGLYYVMGNKWHASTLTKALTGSIPPSKASLEKACFMSKRKGDGFVIMGYGNKAVYKCAANKQEERNVCLPTHESTNEKWAAARGTTEATIVWTDNEKWALGVRCSGMYKTWALRSTENKDVDDDVKKMVKEYVTKNGFKAENILTYPRKNCMD